MRIGDGSASPAQLIVGAIFVLLGLGGISGGGLAALALLVVGAILVWHGLEWGKLKRVKRAFDSVAGSGRVDLQALASQLDMQIPELRDSLDELSRRGLIPKIVTVKSGIDASEGVSQDGISASSGPQQPGCDTPASTSDWVYVAQNPRPIVKTVRCRGCGAVTQLEVGETKECEHCGNRLSL